MKKTNMSLKRFLCACAAFVMILASMPAMEAKALTSPVVNGNEVTFYYESSANEVYLAGDMNGWNPTGEKMNKEGNVFSITMTLEAGEYGYKFVEEGTNWVADPLNTNTKDDGFGGLNTIVVVGGGSSDAGSNNAGASTLKESIVIDGNKVTFYYESSSASTVYLAGDMNSWAPDKDAMTKDGNIFSITMTLEPGTYAYKFVEEGTNWVADPLNTNTVDDGFGGQNTVVEVAGGASSDEGTNNEAAGPFKYTVYAYSPDATRNAVDAAALYIWDKAAETDLVAKDYAFTTTEDLSDGRTWLKAEIELAATQEIGFILKNVGEGTWTWQTSDLIFSNTEKTDVTLYIVDGHSEIYTSLDDIVIEDIATEETETEEDTATEETEKEEVKETEEKEDKDTAADKEKKPMSATTIAWIVVGIVVVAAGVIAFFVVKKTTADLTKTEESEETEE